MNRLRTPFDLSRALFILPNAFTMASIFCGIYAMLHVLEQNGPDDFYQAGIAVFLAVFFDMFDGRIARLTKTQSDFGVEFDSLADVISFGVAPAVIVYKWALWPLGILGVFAAFIFASCGAIRLARHNVLINRKPPNSMKYFIGLPIPFGAAMLVALVIAHYKLFAGLPVQRHNVVLVLVLFIGLLMVSNVPYWTFKELKFGLKPFFALLFVLFCSIALSMVFPASVSLVIFIGLYIFAGLIVYIVNFFLSTSNKAG